MSLGVTICMLMKSTALRIVTPWFVTATAWFNSFCWVMKFQSIYFYMIYSVHRLNLQHFVQTALLTVRVRYRFRPVQQSCRVLGPGCCVTSVTAWHYCATLLMAHVIATPFCITDAPLLVAPNSWLRHAFMMILILHCCYLSISSWLSFRPPSAPRCRTCMYLWR